MRTWISAIVVASSFSFWSVSVWAAGPCAFGADPNVFSYSNAAMPYGSAKSNLLKVAALAPQCSLNDQLFPNIIKAESLSADVQCVDMIGDPRGVNADDMRAQLKRMGERQKSAGVMNPPCSQIDAKYINDSVKALNVKNLNAAQIVSAIRRLRGILGCQYDRYETSGASKQILDAIRERTSDRKNDPEIRYWLTQSACLVYAANLNKKDAPEVETGTLAFKGPGQRLEQLPDPDAMQTPKGNDDKDSGKAGNGG